MLLERLRRTTRDGRWFPEIDGLRFLAVASVLLFHLGGEAVNRTGHILALQPRYHWLTVAIGNGDRGVRLFFVISGFVLALPFARAMLHGGRRVSIRKFYLRRLTRLEPPYLLALAFIALASWTYFHHFDAGYGRHWLATAGYFHSLLYHTVSPVSAVTWSLEVEIQFYLIAPLMMQVLRLRPAWLRRVLLVSFITVWGALQAHYFYYSPLMAGTAIFYLGYFLAGLLVADLYVSEKDRLGNGFVWDAVALAMLLFAGLAGHDWTPAHTLLPFVFGVMCLAAFQGRIFRRLLSVEWVAVIGGMCYSIYLLHLTFYAALFKFTRFAIVPSDILITLLLQVVVTLLPTLVLCTVFYVLIEKPCMDPDWPSHLWRKLTGRRNAEVTLLDSSGISE